MKQNANAYRIVNLLLALVVLGVFAYSLMYAPGKHPIPSIFTDITGVETPSTGLSAAFSELVRGNLNLAKINNAYVLQIFSFFVLQLLLRVSLIFVSAKTNRLKMVVWLDVTFSLALFIYCFWPFVQFIFKMAKLLA